MFIYDPWEEFERFRKFMKRFIRDFETEFPHYSSIPIEIKETDEDIIVRAEIPGFSKDEISVYLTDHTIEISAQHKEKKVEKEERMIRSERRYGAVKRVIALPVEVDPETAEAKLENGILEIKAKKKKASKGKKLDIS